MDKAVEDVTSGCHQCASLKKKPSFFVEQSTLDSPESIGISFAADIMRRERQYILVVRECVTSFTSACIVEDERSDTLRNALLKLCIELRPLDGPAAVVPTDPAPAFQALSDDKMLLSNRIRLEIGRIKNINKNPVAEKAIQEVQDEILRLDPTARTITPVQLAIAVASLNSRVRNRGLSAREMLLQRDQFTNLQLPVNDRHLIQDQHSSRNVNHDYSERSKCPKGTYAPSPSLEVGDIVYLTGDRNKTRARDRYLVVSVEPPWCNVRKFTENQLRNTSYRVKTSDCYKVPVHASSPITPLVYSSESNEDSDSENTPSRRKPSYFTPSSVEEPPNTPPEISNITDYPCVDASGNCAPESREPYVPEHQSDSTTKNTRPRRTVKLPQRFDDFIMS